MRRRSTSRQFLVKMLASETDEPRPLPTIHSFNIEAFVIRSSDISPCEADQRKSRPIHHEAHLLFVECMVTVQNGWRVWGNESVLFTFLFFYCLDFVTARERGSFGYIPASPGTQPPARNYRIHCPRVNGCSSCC